MRRVLCALSLALLCVAAARADEPKGREITTSGEAVVYVVPDEVIVNLSVETRDRDLDKAKSLNDSAAAGLVAAIKRLGVEDKHIQTDHLDVSIIYSDRAELVINGYMARRGYAVTLKDPKKFEPLVATAIKSGANRLNGFSFQTTQLRKHRDQARAMAIRAAREKAQALAGELNCRPGAPRTITEGAGYSSYWGGMNWAGNAFQNSVQMVPGGQGNDEGGTLPLGQIAIRANVSVTFDLIVP